MFENLQARLGKAIKTLKGEGKITEVNVATTVKEIRRALVDADVNYKVAKQITDEIKIEALGKNVLIAVKPGELFIKIVYDKLTRLMGGEQVDINETGNPTVILLAGLNGAGKTTFAGKLAKLLKSQGNKQVLLAACDIYRPAAVEQLKTLGEQIGVDVYAEPENTTDAVAIATNAIALAKKQKKAIVIVDTAGRLSIDEVLMKEITDVKKAIQPQETLFVVDAMTGQDAVNTAKVFNDRLGFDGVILTKLDGDSRGGAALSIRTVVDKPIKYIGTSETMDGIAVFHPDRMAQRILGMGDVLSLVERAQQVYDEEETRRLNKKIRKNQFNFDDFLSQIKQVQKMGNIKDLIGMIPGVGKALKGVEVDEDAFVPIESMIYSMTPFERKNPHVLDSNRKKRIAKGSGRTIQEVNNLIKQFGELRKMMRQMNKTQATQQAGGKKVIRGKRKKPVRKKRRR
jgi:signal recognition particle subunit SRP54